MSTLAGEPVWQCKREPEVWQCKFPLGDCALLCMPLYSYRGCTNNVGGVGWGGDGGGVGVGRGGRIWACGSILSAYLL